MPKVSSEFVQAIRRKRGKKNISVAELSRETGISSWTLRHLLNRDRLGARASTLEKLNQWLYRNV